MLDHSLRSVSFIADIGDVLVLMARQQSEERANKEVLKPSQILASVGTAQTDHKNVKITCHVFQAPEVSPKYIIYLQRCFMKEPSCRPIFNRWVFRNLKNLAAIRKKVQNISSVRWKNHKNRRLYNQKVTMTARIRRIERI